MLASQPQRSRFIDHELWLLQTPAVRRRIHSDVVRVYRAESRSPVLLPQGMPCTVTIMSTVPACLLTACRRRAYELTGCIWQPLYLI